MRYTALTTAGPVDIGEFPDQASAQDWASERYGDALQAVIVQGADTITVTADEPVSGLALLAGAAVLYAISTLSKPRRKSR